MFRVAQTKFHWSQDTRAMGFLWWIGGPPIAQRYGKTGNCYKESQPNLQRKTPGRDSDRWSNVDTGFCTPGLGSQPGQPERPQRMPLVNQRNGSQRAPADDQHGRPQRVAEWPRSSWQQNERSLQNTNDPFRVSVSVNEWNRREPMPTYEWNYSSESVQRPPHRSPPHQPVYQTPQPSFFDNGYSNNVGSHRNQVDYREVASGNFEYQDQNRRQEMFSIMSQPKFISDIVSQVVSNLTRVLG